jgi:hypothetical protein
MCRLFKLLIGCLFNRWQNLLSGVAAAVLLYAMSPNVLSDPTNPPVSLPLYLRQAADDTRLGLPQLDIGFRTQISVQQSLLPEPGTTAPKFLPVDTSTTLARIRMLRQAGASGLALALLKDRNRAQI